MLGKARMAGEKIQPDNVNKMLLSSHEREKIHEN
jgi:hypothetical protein